VNALELFKKKLLENIVFVTILVGFLVYLIIDGAEAELGFIIAFLPWFIFSFSFFSVLFNRKLQNTFKNWVLLSFIFGIVGLVVLLYLGWKEGLYVYVAGGIMIGLILSLIEKVFSRL